MKAKINLTGILILSFAFQSMAQTMEAPGVDWSRTDWYPYNPNTGTTVITAAESGRGLVVCSQE